MKKIFTLLVGSFLFVSILAQPGSPAGEKYDSVIMKSGETKTGTITEVADDAIRFVHKGETLTYTLKKSDIVKIIFLSGRVEIINGPAAGNANSAADHHNKIAVLPFSFINNRQGGDEEMSYKIQNECYNFLSSKTVTLNVQDPNTTNALLAKAGINTGNYRNFTIAEIADAVGIEYIVKGTVTVNAANTSTSENTTFNSKSNNSSSGKTNNNKSTSGNVSSSSTTKQEFKTSVLMEIYTDEGKKIFGQDRTSFWSSAEAYKSTLQYLLKKTPVYGK